MIEVCPKYLRENCNKDVKGCALVIGVAGRDDRLSSYRLKGFYGSNKLRVDEPQVSSSRTEAFNGSYYDFFWFPINDTVSNRYS
jgi:hypothetical protein